MKQSSPEGEVPKEADNRRAQMVGVESPNWEVLAAHSTVLVPYREERNGVRVPSKAVCRENTAPGLPSTDFCGRECSGSGGLRR